MRSFFISSMLPAELRLVSWARSDGQKVTGAGVGGGMAQFRHRPGLDLADPLAGQVEVFADLFERPGLTPVEAEAQPEDLSLPLVERREQPADLLGQQGHRGYLEGGLGGPV